MHSKKREEEIEGESSLETLSMKVTLNADVGEGFGDDVALFQIIDLANIACGFHAGNPTMMSRTVEMAKMYDVLVGAHPSFPDREGFGRRMMDMTPEEILNSLLFQIGALDSFLRKNGMKLNHVKPHGKLYGLTAKSEHHCQALLDAVEIFKVPLLGFPGSLHEEICRKRGIEFIPEFFADLDYDSNGSLIITRTHEEVNIDFAADRVERALYEKKVASKNGKVDLDIKCGSVCVHSDTPNSIEIARRVRKRVDFFNSKFFKLPENAPTLLIANRGEIACRIIRCCKKMRIRSVAIYTKSDKNSDHVLKSDIAVEVESYVDIPKLVETCKNNNVKAVHPGYGFLSENHEFCAALEKENIEFLGPTSKQIEIFGQKHTAREFAVKQNVPIVPGTGLLKSVEDAVEGAKKLGYPVLLKATGAGGGIGMSVCKKEDDIKKAFESCQRSGKAFFGNGDVYLERYYPQSRHIEIQVFGDGKGNVIHLNERECSVQRRNQKVVEETPSPFLMKFSKKYANLRERMCEAAVNLANSVSYRSAGTVEFLVVDEGEESEETGKFFFLEMNTRLQVEHGVTELTTNVDIVELMIKLGLGMEINLEVPKMLARRKKKDFHAIEVRLYAEKPSRNFMPSPGLLTNVKFFGEEKGNIRIDTWIKTGIRIPSEYDPLLAKVMVTGNNRNECIDNMIECLEKSIVLGTPTNLEYLQRIIEHDAFREGLTTTKFLEKYLKDYSPNSIDILDGGINTEIQDWPGRLPLRVYGIQPSCPMDDISFRVANLMVGNMEGTEGLEILLRGPKILFHRHRRVAICGADFEIKVIQEDKKNGGKIVEKKKMWSSFLVKKGSILHVGRRIGKIGCRCYLAIEGGLDIPLYLNSKTTFSPFGGYQGRELRTGDMIPLLDIEKKITNFGNEEEMILKNSLIPKFPEKKNWELKVMVGPHADPLYTTEKDIELCFSTDWKVHHNSNRKGIRLIGPNMKWARPNGGDGGSHPSNIHDCGYALGSVNFTGDMPVILTTDGPTQGGFTCPWTILSSELWKLGQICPGDTIRFIPVLFDEAVKQINLVKKYLTLVRLNCIHFPFQIPYDVDEEIDSKILQTFTRTKLEKENYCGKALVSMLKGNEKKGLPDVYFYQAGDRYLLLEYGDAEIPLDLKIAVRIRKLQEILGLITDTVTQKTKANVVGMIDAAPSVRALLIRYDPLILPQKTLVEYLKYYESQIPDFSNLEIQTREIRLPIVLNDRWTNEAIKMYMNQIRKKAVYLPSNLQFIADNNALDGINGACSALIGCPWLVVGVGFYLGCPFAIPTNPLLRLNVPKYNPARTFTPSGAVGIGGSFLAIYPMESPGGYQIYGRTIQTWDTFGQISPFIPQQPWLLNLFDLIVFERVSEEELLDCRRRVTEGTYTYKISNKVFKLKDQLEIEKKVEKEVIEMRKKQQIARKKMMEIEKKYLEEYNSEKGNVVITEKKKEELEIKEGYEAEISDLSGVVLKIGKDIEIGKKIDIGSVILTVEAMKMEMTIKSNSRGTIERVFVESNQQINAGDNLIVVKLE